MKSWEKTPKWLTEIVLFSSRVFLSKYDKYKFRISEAIILFRVSIISEHYFYLKYRLGYINWDKMNKWHFQFTIPCRIFFFCEISSKKLLYGLTLFQTNNFISNSLQFLAQSSQQQDKFPYFSR
jgi:hypothetical protein